jgi:GTPase SAR1 family protein
MSILFKKCEKNLIDLISFYQKTSTQKRNEATTRLQLIDRLLIDCLGWDSAKITSEDRITTIGNFKDYTFSNPQKMVVVEAKKAGVFFEIPITKKNDLVFSITSLCKGNKDLRLAIEQVSGYCANSGIPVACVTNGHQLLIFLGSRTDGIEPLRGKILVFSSLELMGENFIKLWNSLSPEGLNQNHLYSILAGETSTIIPQKPSSGLAANDYPGFKTRTSFQNEFDTISELIFRELTYENEIEDRFLRECYCQSNYLSDYTSLTKKILKARYSSLANIGLGITQLSNFSMPSLKKVVTKKPIVILGDVNVGKTTFIRNFIKVEAHELLIKFINLYIDLKTQANLEKDLREFIPKEIKSQLKSLYSIDIDDHNFVRGVYRKDLKKFRASVLGEYKDTDPEKFKEEEINFLYKKSSDLRSHLRASLFHLLESQKRKIVIFFDNADQRDESDQNKTFSVAQELAANWGIIVFVTLRPETFNKLKTSGFTEGTYSKIFTIHPPALEEVIKKRLEFAIKLAKGELKISKLQPDLSIRFINFSHLLKIFLETLEDINKKDIPECIENISAGNVTISLELLQNFFGNPYINQSDMLEKYKNTGKYIIPFYKFLKSVILNDRIYFSPTHSLIANLFDISSEDEKEHFICPILLAYLCEKQENKNGFVEVGKVYEFLQGFGFNPRQINNVISRSLEKKLIETCILSSVVNIQDARFRITESGAYYVQKLSFNFTYFDAMIIDTPIVDRDLGSKINIRASSLSARLQRAKLVCQYLDKGWKNIKKNTTFFDWQKCSDQIMSTIGHINEIIQDHRLTEK